MQRGYRVLCSVLIIYRRRVERARWLNIIESVNFWLLDASPMENASGTLLRRLRQALVSNLIDPIRKSGRHPLDVKLVPICWPRIRGYQRVLFVCQRSEWYVRCNGISHISYIISRVIVFPQSRPHQKATL